jgi:hypothetical protein
MKDQSLYKEKYPAVVYKYRSWNNDHHKRIITNREAWLAHPHALNDPHDVRPPYNLITDNVDWFARRVDIRQRERYFDEYMPEEELHQKVEQQIVIEKAEQIAYFQKNNGEYILGKRHYDVIGIFSCCASGVNELMWDQYGNNDGGFAVGFVTVELISALQCSVDYVNYNDMPVNFYLSGDNDYEKIIENEIFQKSTRWKEEEELRFVKAGIKLDGQRVASFPVQAVSEIIFGVNTSQQVQNEIIAASKTTLPGISFYQLGRRPDGEGYKIERKNM